MRVPRVLYYFFLGLFTHDFWEISRSGLGPSDLPRSRLLERQAAVIVNPVGCRLVAESAGSDKFGLRSIVGIGKHRAFAEK